MKDYPDNPGPLDPLVLKDKPDGNGPLGGAENEDHDIIKHLQQMLLVVGYERKLGDTGDDQNGVDGIYGKLTREAVVDFQKKNEDWEGNSLKDDGLVGPRTADALNHELIGIWYGEYHTPIELVEKTHLLSATRPALEQGVTLQFKKAEKVKVVLSTGPTEQIITLLDDQDKAFSFEGKAKWEVLDDKRNNLGSGELDPQSGRGIRFTSNNFPATVRLVVGSSIFLFDLTKTEGENSAGKQ
ncbi:hypothetical protein AUG19_00245 [archaeon 13_1_20CM_2_54_9]|nr:MAG: hypothetical protein AUJ07_03785 [Crenarchaeota archaeon 13_1_40CM_3_53_5]OLE77483.1 MAG: hypothetical protein AUG19_00245 [archaeon 13_1_20CM_2_54_9]